MIIIDKKDFELYRFAVAKIIFLKEYSQEYTLLENIKESNCLLVKNAQRKLIISIFSKPNISLENKGFHEPILIYYQKPQYKKYNDKNRVSIYRMLTETFDKQYNEALNFAVLNPHEFINNNKELDFLLDEIKLNACIAYDTSGVLYKYYSADKIKNNSYNVNDGIISFLNPKHFNDPFDCSCILSNNESISDKFRVFCSIQDERNILMWSYYGSDHNGYCFKYSKHDIISALINSNINGLCIVGNVQYSDKRPNYKSQFNFLSYTNIKFLIDCTFTKYKKWEHEEEYRFVIISDFFRDDGNATTLKVNVNEVLSGCQGTSSSIIDSKHNAIPVKQLQKDDLEYKLV